MKLRILAALAVLAVAIATTVVACESRTASASCSTARECLPSVNYQDINHEQFTPQALRGKIVVVNFWATWCGPCKKEIPAFNRVYTQYKDKGVVMLGILDDNQVDDMGLLNFMSDFELTYPVIRADQDIKSAYEFPNAFPTTFVYDRNGKLATWHRGPMSEEDLTALLDDLLKKP